MKIENHSLVVWGFSPLSICTALDKGSPMCSSGYHLSQVWSLSTQNLFLGIMKGSLTIGQLALFLTSSNQPIVCLEMGIFPQSISRLEL